ncbi:MAG: helix-turn-helix transcriptional regulator [Yoonia sp.]|uniref:helix-turn-helix transcriptional regulator n=1 Tax=Yoonia sp. TaxID=2212373 RepID=UPI00273F4428|nr:helix-turn-helix transcriptional regulator [Yoonia sp.]MDP5086585.1 helix-turn-helix transcriptional regulator [Yoonia sp.]
MTKQGMTEERRTRLRRSLFLAAALLQLGCGLVFAFDVIVEMDNLTGHTWVELMGIIALAIGAFITVGQYRELLRRNTKIERELGAASGAFQDVIEQHFQVWQLTEAERDVALLSIKGVPIADIAVMRQTRSGTIKAQSAAIYRKSGVSSRAELISVMIEELIAGLDLTTRPSPAGMSQKDKG